VLPFSSLNEAGQILANFSKELRRSGLGEIEREIQRNRRTEVCFEFSVVAGLAEGRSSENIAQVFRKAETRQRTIARFECEIGSKGPLG